MKAILLLCLFLMMAFTATASAAVHTSPAGPNVVQASTTPPVQHTLDLKDAATISGVTEYIFDLYGRRVDPARAGQTRWDAAPGLPTSIQTSPPRHGFGWVHYPLRN